MHLPQPIATDIHEESFAGVTYHIRGQLVPELQVELTERRVMHEHHVLLWKETGVDIELRKLKGGVKRKIAGLDFFVTRAIGPGRIAFSRDSPGQCIPLHLRQGDELHVREHQFIAATDNLDYDFERIKGARNMLLGGSGFFMDKFRATDGDALVWLHGHGNVFEVHLDAGEQLDVEAGALAVQGPHRQARVRLHGAEDRALRRRGQAHVEPFHRTRAPGPANHVRLAHGGRRGGRHGASGGRRRRGGRAGEGAGRVGGAGRGGLSMRLR